VLFDVFCVKWKKSVIMLASNKTHISMFIMLPELCSTVWFVVIVIGWLLMLVYHFLFAYVTRYLNQ
jgi:sensor histidine kinase YesM